MQANTPTLSASAETTSSIRPTAAREVERRLDEDARSRRKPVPALARSDSLSSTSVNGQFHRIPVTDQTHDTAVKRTQEPSASNNNGRERTNVAEDTRAVSGIINSTSLFVLILIRSRRSQLLLAVKKNSARHRRGNIVKLSPWPFLLLVSPSHTATGRLMMFLDPPRSSQLRSVFLCMHRVTE